MPIIRFTDGDRLASTIVPADYYTMELMEVDGPKKSSSEKSFNTYYKFQICEGDYQGKEITVILNTGSKGASMLNGAQYVPASWGMPIYAAIKNIPLGEVPLEIDTDTMLRQPFDAKIEKGIYDGSPGNMISAFLPKGAGANAAKVPF